ncbi:hypothetical protein [Stenotrophomonas sp. Marseille-Q4652]|uniref:hypothetical protein n=1 Tax=Stenotrophomonas sp. Marseille-Q4652 TaxID=2866595 RepID=UPI001CE4AAE6|nr:hypothetical protein [Stenotrophomonas sp. Marseille-Q4652]
MAFGNGTLVSEALPPYDQDVPPTCGQPKIGQIVRTVVPELGMAWKVFDATRSDQTSHNSASGTIRGANPQHDWRPKPNRLPIFRLGVGESTELLALNSKLRPCIVLATADDIPDLRLPQPQRNIARQAFMRPSYLVAPLFSVGTPNEPRSVTPTIAARAECLVYPQLVFLPRTGGIIRNDSVARLDRAFWTTLPQPTELEAMSLSRIRMSILHGQLLTLRGLAPDQDYIDLVEILRTELAEEHAEHLE